MSQNSAPPSIESLLKESNWEERLAEARAKREKVLAAKAADKETAKGDRPPQEDAATAPVSGSGAKPATVPAEPPEPRPEAPARRKTSGLVLALAVGLSFGVVLGGVGVWLYQTGLQIPGAELE